MNFTASSSMENVPVRLLKLASNPAVKSAAVNALASVLCIKVYIAPYSCARSATRAWRAQSKVSANIRFAAIESTVNSTLLTSNEKWPVRLVYKPGSKSKLKSAGVNAMPPGL